MYAAILLAALFASPVFAVERISSGAEFGAGIGLSFQVVSDQALRSHVESAVANIDRIARSPWTAEQKLSAIQVEAQKVESYRKSNWSRSPATAHKLDLLIRPYESFPEASEYRRQNCTQYFSTLKVDWEPTASSAPTLRGVKRAWNNLKAICNG